MSIQILIIIFFSTILIARILFSKDYRIYYMITAFFSLRLWMAILAAIYYASGNIYMEEIEEYTKNYSEITLTLFLVGIIYLFLESLASKYITNQYKKLNIQVNKNIYSKFLLIFVVLFFFINIYLAWETITTFDPISANKMVFINFTHFPYLYKILEPISLFSLIVIAYGLAINKLSVNKTNKPKINLINFVFILGLALFTFRFIHIHAKSPYIVILLLYFITPIYIFCYKFNIVFFKNKAILYITLIIVIVLILFTFYTHYGNGFIMKIVDRVLLEGQLLYSSLEYFYSKNFIPSFLNHFPGNDDNTRGMVYMMEKFLPQHRLNQFYATGWQMSGTLPGYNFMFYDLWIAFTYWFINWLFFIFLISRGIQTFLFGQITRTFIYLNISFLVGFFYLILGSNYLFSYRFWILVFLLIFIELIMHINQKKVIQKHKIIQKIKGQK